MPYLFHKLCAYIHLDIDTSIKIQFIERLFQTYPKIFKKNVCKIIVDSIGDFCRIRSDVVVGARNAGY